MTSTLSSRIDVHSHFLPPRYHDELVQNGHSNPDGMPAIPPWSPEAHLEMMTATNITKSILSISSPGTNLAAAKPELARDLTRYCNSYAADLKKKYPDKFGFWASLPLPDVEASLKEIDLALAEGCDGFALLTNYHGHYIGSTIFDTVFEKLHTVSATIFIHPTKPYCCAGPGAGLGGSGSGPIPALPLGDTYPVPMFEFLFDTARAVINLFVSGTIDRCPNITFIVPHAGGTLPPLLSRFTRFSHVVPAADGRVMNAETVRRQLDTNFYFDLAGFVFLGERGGEGQVKALVEGSGVSWKQLLYGSDFPFTPARNVGDLAVRMDGGLQELFKDEEKRRAVYRENAVGLLAKDRTIGSKI